MQESTSREKLLKKLRNALIQKTPNPYPSLDLESSFIAKSEDSLEVQFAKNLINQGAAFVFCANRFEFVESLITISGQYEWEELCCNSPELVPLLEQCDFPFFLDSRSGLKSAMITNCISAVASSGSIILSKNGILSKHLAEYETLICIVSPDQLTYDLDDALVGCYSVNSVHSDLLVLSGNTRKSGLSINSLPIGATPAKLFVFLCEDLAGEN